MASGLAVTPTTNHSLLEVSLPGAGVAIELGRDRTTRVTAPKCSRKQLSFTVRVHTSGSADGESQGETVVVTALKGGLPGTCGSVNGKVLHATQSHELRPRETFRFIHSDPDTEYMLVRVTAPRSDGGSALSGSGGGTDVAAAAPATAAVTLCREGISTAHAPRDAPRASSTVRSPSPRAGRGVVDAWQNGAGPAVSAASSVTPTAGGATGGAAGINAFAMLMDPGRGGTEASSREPARSAAATPAASTAAPRTDQGAGPSWFTALNAYVEHPERHADDIVHRDAVCTVIRDKFPKAKVHLLVLSNRFIPDLLKLTTADVPTLKHMLSVAQQFETKEMARDPALVFRTGLHAIPSMERLHVHLISQDFSSPCLKNKKHWNSFASEFFLSATDVLGQLETTGGVTIDRARYEAVLKQDLRCHRCGITLRNMPKLKEHIALCA